MSVKIRELINVIGWKVDKTQMKNANSMTSKFIKGLKNAGLAVGAAIIALGTAAINAAADMESLTSQFEVMLGSAEEAAKLMEELKTFAAETPFALKDLAQGTQNLISFGVPANEALQTMRMLGDTAGGNAEKLKSLVLAYGKVQTKGKVSMEEIYMIAERGVPIIKTLQEQLGVTEQQFFKLVSAGKIGKEAMKTAFQTMTSEGGMFFEGMKTASLTFNGLVSTMKDNITLLLAEIGNKLLPTMKIVVQKITELFRGPLGEIISDLLKVIDPILKIVLQLVETILDGLMPIIKSISSLLVPLLNIVAILLEPINEILKILLDTFGDMIEDLTKILVPLLTETAILLKELMPLLMPLIKIMAQWLALSLKLNAIFNTLLFKIMIKGFTLALRIINKILSVVKTALTPAFEELKKIFEKITNFFEKTFDNILEKLQEITESITNFFEKVFNNITDRIKDVMKFIFTTVNKVITQINKLPFIKKKIQPLDIKALEDVFSKKENNNTNQNNTNITMNNDNQFNGVDMSQKGRIKNEVQQAIATPFQLELLRVIEDL